MNLVFLLLYLLPISLILFRGLPHVLEILKDPYYVKIILFTVKQAVLSTVLSLLAGLPGAWIMTRKTFKGKRFVEAVYRIPFVLPSILTVLGFVIFYGNNGYLNSILPFQIKLLYSFKAVLFAHVFYNFPVIVSLVSSSWKTLDSRVEDAAKTDGAGPAKIFFSITLPRLKSSILSACALVFLYCFSSFAIILVLGGSPDLTTAEVEIYRLGRILLDTDRASALSIVSSLIACVMLFVYRKIQTKNSIQENGNQPETKLGFNVPILIYLVISVLFIICPLLSVILRSFFSSASRGAEASFSLKAYSAIDAKTIFLTVSIALVSSALSVLMALGFCRRKIRNDLPVLLPMATSSVILGLGYFVISRRLSFINPLVLTVCAHSILNTGFAFKTIEPAFSRIPDTISNQAKVDGASEKRILLDIKVPIVSKSLRTAFLFCSALSAGELNSTLLLGNGNIQTIPVAIYRMIGAYNFRGACALGTVLMVLTLLLFEILHAVTDRGLIND